MTLRHTQRGSSLIIGLIMLFMTTVSLVAAYNMSATNVSIIKNLQDRELTVDLANSTLEAAVSNARLVQNPDAIFVNGGGGASNTQTFDINLDGEDDVVVTIDPPPFCLQSRTIQNASLDVTNPEDAGCVVSGIGNFGVAGSGSQNSLCAGSTWQVNAVATDAVTSTSQTVTGFYSIRVPTDSVDSFCP